MKVYIFTEGSSKIGYGHIVRCSALYQELEKRNIDVEFVINGGKEIAEVEVLEGKKKLIKNWLSKDFLINLLKEDSYSIVDSYLAEQYIYEIISSNSTKALFIDDNARINYPDGIVVNPSIYTDELDYSNSGNIDYLLGSKYVILRDSFKSGRRKCIKKDIEEILIVLGGSDIRNLTPKILSSLKVEYPNITKNVIIGKGFCNIEQIKSVKDKNINYYYNIDGNQMKELMLKSDLAISAAGQTIYELIKTETPFIPIQVIENQNNNIKGLLKYNIAHKVLKSQSDNIIDELLKEVKYLINYQTRLTLNIKLTGFIDGLGSARIINKLLGIDEL
ncbi:UDP-2,4-diacetamido-2,4,6-trideoxy-beta-L-altropyranose hydrolase [Clostridium grantii]|uniref:UDP-2,4-diacetamido-2,4,6-trideoxy-beta-L-altropyranose hydrolase n=1 Tax=Clostridium grantii DSM 8605 TaxID=1121316 RepID=A0A1M5W720_9CLOT|nr:UDP-2,4-diacetamido-2,4,6-trideoxy-beta-L-altropyranose hydrolase [Clostridium grantii]SHH83265.1 UDP-2,4-diacetamido-2,4,6-trideoxy-beta-L-altropyranose hydrolase [Clostridium grantii DSM 8605]